MLRVYIAGPMEGLKDHNAPAFKSAADRLTGHGWLPFNPAKPPLKTELSRRELMAHDLTWIATRADGIYMLRGWELSSGAFAEWALARALNLQIFYE